MFECLWRHNALACRTLRVDSVSTYRKGNQMNKRNASLLIGAVIGSFTIGLTIPAHSLSTPSAATLVDQACKSWNSGDTAGAHLMFRKLSAIDAGFIPLAAGSAMQLKIVSTVDSMLVNQFCVG